MLETVLFCGKVVYYVMHDHTMRFIQIHVCIPKYILVFISSYSIWENERREKVGKDLFTFHVVPRYVFTRSLLKKYSNHVVNKLGWPIFWTKVRTKKLILLEIDKAIWMIMSYSLMPSKSKASLSFLWVMDFSLRNRFEVEVKRGIAQANYQG